MEDQQQSSKETKAALTRAVTRAQNADQALTAARTEKQAADRGVRDALAAHAAAVEHETKEALGWATTSRTGARARTDAQAPASTPTRAHTRVDDDDTDELTDGERLVEHVLRNGGSQVHA